MNVPAFFRSRGALLTVLILTSLLPIQVLPVSITDGKPRTVPAGEPHTRDDNAAQPIRASGAPAGEDHSPESLSHKDRQDVFEEVWKRINEKYYDSTFHGVNWRALHDSYRPRIDTAKNDYEFYSLLNDMIGKLHDAHTRLHTPLERQERERSQAVTAGASIDEIEGKAVIVQVEPDSDAARAGVEPGMIVSAIDGVAAQDKLRELRGAIGGSSTERAVQLRLYHKMLDGDPGTRVSLKLIRGDGTQFSATLMRRTVSDAPRIVSRWLPSGYGYLKLTLWKSPIHDQFKTYLEKFREAPGLIIDLRGNPGGEVNEVLKIAGYFFATKVPFGRFVTRSGKNLDLYTGRDGDPVYGGPVAILVNEASGSGSEMFSGVMQESGRAIVIGRQSCGCLLGISQYKKLKGGAELAISELGYVSPRGRRLEGVGVIPDEAVSLTLADLQRRRDATIEGAESALGTHLKTSNGPH